MENGRKKKSQVTLLPRNAKGRNSKKYCCEMDVPRSQNEILEHTDTDKKKKECVLFVSIVEAGYKRSPMIFHGSKNNCGASKMKP